MIAGASRLVPRVLALTLTFSLASATLVALIAPWLLLHRDPLARGDTGVLLSGMCLGGALAALRAWWRLSRHRFALRALGMGSDAVEPHELAALLEEDRQLTLGWLLLSVLALLVVAISHGPGRLDLHTGLSLALLGTVLVAAASLPLRVLLRGTLMRAIELAPPNVMHEVVAATAERGHAGKRLRDRLLVALVTPIVFVTVGAGLIAAAHLRREDVSQREETARALARAALEPQPALVEGAGIDAALKEAGRDGFVATVLPQSDEYRVRSLKGGFVELTAPLDGGSATVRFAGSTVPVLGPEALLVAGLAVLGAIALGLLLARALNDDLTSATRGVRLLDTESVMRGAAQWTRSSKFRAVDALGRSVEQLAARFRVFAHAQERAIDAREAVTRTRGLFFASVSHDLKSPLNAILGFTELVRNTPGVTDGQAESLEVIETRGRELLALIETILDAARVEAGQLRLVHEPVDMSELIADAIEKGRDLGANRLIDVVGEIGDRVPTVIADRVRLARALATFIGHAARTGGDGPAHLRAVCRHGGGVVLDVEVPSRGYPARRLLGMLNRDQQPGAAEHRGLALALSLARSIVELHGGVLTVADRAPERVCFRVELDPALCPPTGSEASQGSPSSPAARSARPREAPAVSQRALPPRATLVTEVTPLKSRL